MGRWNGEGWKVKEKAGKRRGRWVKKGWWEWECERRKEKGKIRMDKEGEGLKTTREGRG